MPMQPQPPRLRPPWQTAAAVTLVALAARQDPRVGTGRRGGLVVLGAACTSPRHQSCHDKARGDGGGWHECGHGHRGQEAFNL